MRHPPRGYPAKSNADNPAKYREHNGFGQKLLGNIAALRANGLAQADFARAFGYRGQHHIHNANTADNQGYAGHRG